MNLNQVTIPVTNIPNSIAFYEKLGCLLIVHTHDAYARFELPDGDATLSLSLVEQLPKENGIKIYFECNDLDEKVNALKKAGIVFESDPKDQSWL